MGALTGYKILDFSTLLPGPFATMLISDMGAEVLCVNSPANAKSTMNLASAEDLAPTDALLRRNKKQIVLDLKKRSAVQIVLELVKEYDIVLEQFRPGVMDKLGIGYEALKKANPNIIYCALTGYGQTGPYSMRAGHDINYVARSGVMSFSGAPGELPPILGVQMADQMSGSVNTIIGLLAAILHRERTGEGQYVDISMTDGMVSVTSAFLNGFIAGREKDPNRPVPAPGDGPLSGSSYYGYYRTKDDRFMSVGSIEPKFFAAACKALGHPEFANGSCSPTGEQMRSAFAQSFSQKSQAEWIEIFSKIDACVEPVMNLEEVANDPQTAARGMITQVPIPGTDRCMTQPGNPIKMSKTPPEFRHTGYQSNFHTREVLKGLGYDEEKINALFASKAVM